MNESDSIAETLQRFKSRMLIERPFYGDILLRVPVVRDDNIPTACTDGRTIRWSSKFFNTLTPAQQRYVLMHEVFHTILRHPSRMQGQDHQVWNVATDIIVNHYCDLLALDLQKIPGLRLERPRDGIFRDIEDSETAENLYGKILALNRSRKKDENSLFLRKSYRPKRAWKDGKQVEIPAEIEKIMLPEADLKRPRNGGAPLTPEEEQALEEAMRVILNEAGSHDRGLQASCFMPRELLRLTRSKPLDWRRILKEFLSEAQSDDTSYATPERKYLHMDLILPGHSLSEEGELESIWAFVDSSGSVSHADLEEFLSQLYQIAREFRCEVNIAYWDTSVTDVYEKLRNEKQVLTAQPKHSGGTDINCVYRYAAERNLKPLATLILTDGYFGMPDRVLQKALPARSTVLVLCNNSENPVYKTVGRICRLKNDP